MTTSQASSSSHNLTTKKKIHGWQPLMHFHSDSGSNAKLLRLKIHSGHNLAKKDIFGASDPYVRIDLLKKDSPTVIDSVYTKTKKKTLNPCWNEEFIFRVLPASHHLLIEVFDENRLTRDDFLGKVELDLNNIQTESEGFVIKPQRYVLQQRSQKSKVRGDLEIYHGFIDSSLSTSSSFNTNQDGDSDSINHSPSVDEPDWEIVSHNASQDTVGSNEDLPSGWEECQDTNGRTYFVNHNLRTTQWERPPKLNIVNTPSYQQENIGDTTNSSLNEASIIPSTSSSTTTASKQNAPGLYHRYHIGSSLDRSNNSSIDDGSSNQSCNENPSTQLDNLSTNSRPGSEANISESSRHSANQNLQQQQQQHGSTETNFESSPTTSQSNENNDRTQQQTPPRPNSRPHSSRVNSPLPNSSSIETLGALPTGWTQQVCETGRVFFIDHNNKTTTWIDPRTGKPSPSPSRNNNNNKQTCGKYSAVDDLGPLPSGWEERVHRDGRIFFINHNTRTTQWEDPRIDIPSISGPPIFISSDYKRKYEHFQKTLPRPNGPNKFEIKVKRNNILEDSFRIIDRVSRVDYLKTKLWIEFDSEDVLDYGGPTREWFYLLSKEMFNPYYGLFEYSSTDKYTLQIRPFSGRCNDMHLRYFKFIGRVAGMAIYHGKLLDAFFIRPFYKMMLEKEITLKDMESVDTEYYNSLKYILENDPSELYLNFSIDEKFLDVVEEKELKPNGAQIPVTNENKQEYINLVIDWRFVSRVKPQMDAFLEGFHEIIPKDLIKLFDENELELLMCGIGNVDVKDWKQNTVYKGGYHLNHIVIQWFWRVVLSFNNEMRSRLLQFVTGTSRVPMNGFKELYGSNGPQLFTIEKWGKPQNLPRSHTCFNRLDLPCYESYSDLRDKLIKAIEGSETYGGVD